MTDKKYHVLAGLLVAALVGIGCYVGSYNENTDTYSLFSGLWGCLAGIIAGGVKEYCDMRTEGNKWDWLDFGCTCIGAVLVALFIILLHYGKG